MIEIKEKKECCGCYGCYNVCPTSAIMMIQDEKGFFYPQINEEKCIKCNKCERVCPVINTVEKEKKIKVYAAYNKDEKTRLDSSSGGIFNLIANYVISKDGVVYGATFNEKFEVVHEKATTIEELSKLRKSKYVQSQIKDIYKEVKKFLDKGVIVLFTGTPCQLEGLNFYLGKEYENLYTQDIICHGVPSPKVWNKYLEFIKREKDEKISYVNFRQKMNGWKNFNMDIKLKKEGELIRHHAKDFYFRLFLQNYSLRDTCYDCKFKKKYRNSDITLADFWGIETIMPNLDDDKGTSLIIVNTEKGQEILNAIKKDIEFKECDFDLAIKNNPSMIRSVKMPKNREAFFKELDTIEFDKLSKRYEIKTSILKRVLSKCKTTVKRILK